MKKHQCARGLLRLSTLCRCAWRHRPRDHYNPWTLLSDASRTWQGIQWRWWSSTWLV